MSDDEGSLSNSELEAGNSADEAPSVDDTMKELFKLARKLSGAHNGKVNRILTKAIDSLEELAKKDEDDAKKKKKKEKKKHKQKEKEKKPKESNEEEQVKEKEDKKAKEKKKPTVEKEKPKEKEESIGKEEEEPVAAEDLDLDPNIAAAAQVIQQAKAEIEGDPESLMDRIRRKHAEREAKKGKMNRSMNLSASHLTSDEEESDLARLNALRAKREKRRKKKAAGGPGIKRSNTIE